MGKRKLSRRQNWRIEKIQQERMARANKRDSSIDNDTSLGPEREGLVIAHYGMQVEVESFEDTQIRQRCYFRTNLGSLVTGDRVVWRQGDTHGVVVAIQPRQSDLSRPDPYAELKTIAANIDRILIVIAPKPKPHTQLVDRYLVAGEAQGIKPTLIINKMDLVNADNQDMIDSFISMYTALGYEVISASAKRDEGLSTLVGFLSEHTSIFVGQSGVGKSSLINTLIPDLNLQVGALSTANEKGTHTTTTAKLFHFPGGGHLIDSPGIREFGLWHLSEETILEGFVEFRPLIGQCKFRNCQHRQEPGCAILQAHQEGLISDYRMNSFNALRDQKA